MRKSFRSLLAAALVGSGLAVVADRDVVTDQPILGWRRPRSGETPEGAKARMGAAAAKRARRAQVLARHAAAGAYGRNPFPRRAVEA